MSNPHFDLDLDTLSGMRPLRQAVFSLGSNLGDSLEYLQLAVDSLALTPDLIATDISSVYTTVPVGYTDQPDFLNLILIAETTLSSAVLLDRSQAIEDGLGRTREYRWGPRTVDIDLIAVGRKVLDSETLTLPHPRAFERAFVLVPWLEADPAAELVGHGRVADLVAGLDTSGVRKLTDVTVSLS